LSNFTTAEVFLQTVDRPGCTLELSDTQGGFFVETRAVDIKTLVEEKIVPISRTEIYRAIRRGDLRVLRLGRRILITPQAIDDFLRRLEAK